MSTGKRLLSVLMCVAMLVSMLTVFAVADTTETEIAPQAAVSTVGNTGAKPTTDVKLTVDANVYVVDKNASADAAYTLTWEGTEYADLTFTYGTNLFQSITDAQSVIPVGATVLVKNIKETGKVAFNVAANYYTEAYNTMPYVVGTAFDGSDWTANADYTAKSETLIGVDVKITDAAKSGHLGLYGFTCKYGDYAFDFNNTTVAVDVTIQNTYHIGTTTNTYYILSFSSFASKEVAATSNIVVKNFYESTSTKRFFTNQIPNYVTIDGLYVPSTVDWTDVAYWNASYNDKASKLTLKNWNVQSEELGIYFQGANQKNYFSTDTDATISGASGNRDFRAIEISNCTFNNSSLLTGNRFLHTYANCYSAHDIYNNRIINTTGTVIPFMTNNSTTYANHLSLDLHDNYIVGYSAVTGLASNVGNGSTTGISIKDNYFAATKDAQGETFFITSTKGTKDWYATNYYLDADMSIKNTDLANGVDVTNGMVAVNGSEIYVYVPAEGDYEIVAKEGYSVEYDLGSVTVTYQGFTMTYNLNIVNLNSTPITQIEDETGLIDAEKAILIAGEAYSVADYDVVEAQWKGKTYSAIKGVNAFHDISIAQEYAAAHELENPSFIFKSFYFNNAISTGETEYNTFLAKYPGKFFTQNYDKKPYKASDRAVDPDGSDWASNVNTGAADSFNTADGVEIKWFGLSTAAKGRYEFYGFTITNCIQDSDARDAENQLDVLFQNTYFNKVYSNAIFLTNSAKFQTYASANTYFDKVYVKDAYVENNGVNIGFFENGSVRIWRDLTLDGIFADYANIANTSNHWFDALTDSHNFTIKNSNLRNAQYKLMFEGDNGTGVDKGKDSDAYREFEKAIVFDNNIFYNFTISGGYTGAFVYVKQCFHTWIHFTNNFVFTGKDAAVNLFNGQAGDDRRPNTYVRVDNNTLLGINSLYGTGRWLGTTAPCTTGTDNNFVTDEIISAENVLAGNITATGDVYKITTKATQGVTFYDENAWYDYARTIKVSDLADYNNVTSNGEIVRDGDKFTVTYDSKLVPTFEIENVSIAWSNADGAVETLADGTYTATASKEVDGCTFTKEYEVTFVAVNTDWNFDEETGTLTVSKDLGNFAVKTAPWYEYANDVKAIVVEEGVTEIGDWAFNYCFNAESVSLPSTLERIGVNSFYRCQRLTKVEIPETVTEIASGAFSYCYALSEVNVPENITTINSYAFFDCNKLQKVSAAENLTIKAGNEPFEKAYEIGAIEDLVFEWKVEDGVLTISGNTFMPDYTSKNTPWYDKQSEITKVVIEDGILGIGAYSFAYLTSLKEVEIASTVKVIAPYAFYGCGYLKEVKIPSAVTEIGSGAFAYCILLEKVTLSPNQTKIANYAFYDCKIKMVVSAKSLEDITIGTGNDPLYTAILNKKDVPEASVHNIGEQTVKVGGEDYTLETAYCFGATESFEEVNANSEYKYYHADFVVSFDKDITDVALAGYYDEYAEAVMSTDWVPMVLENKKAGEETRLLKDMWFGEDGSISYQELCVIEQFLCGALDVNDNDAGAKMTVELRLYEVTENAPETTVETGEYVTVGSYEYTF